jgi:O-antigen/teichoic acid export membrane protein
VASPAGLNRQLGSNALAKLGSEVIGRLATLVLALLAARRLGSAGFGHYSYGLATGFVLAQVADMGLQTWISREVAVHGRAARPVIRQALALKLALSVVVALALLLIAAGRPPSVRAAILALGLAMMLQTYLEFGVYVFRGDGRLAIEAQLLAAARLLTAAFGILALWLVGSLTALALAHLATLAVACALAFARLRAAGWLVASSANPAPGWASVARPALPLGIATFISIAYSRLAFFLLDWRLGPAAVGYFGAAHRLVEPTQLLPAALMAAVFPVLAAASVEPGLGAGRLLWQSAGMLAAAGLVVALLLWLVSPWLAPALYGRDYLPAVPVLRWLALSVPPAYANYSLTHALIARGRQRGLALLMLLMLLSHAGLSALLLPAWGIIGPAISIVAAELLLLAGCLALLARRS